MPYVVNPLTGYKIKVNGPTYKRLEEEGYMVEDFAPYRKSDRSKSPKSPKRKKKGGCGCGSRSPGNPRTPRTPIREMRRATMWQSPIPFTSPSKPHPRPRPRPSPVRRRLALSPRGGARRTGRRAGRRTVRRQSYSPERYSYSPGTTKRGKKTGPLPDKSKVMNLKVAKQRSLKETLENLPTSRKARRESLKKQIKKKEEGRGSRTRGWAAAAPQRGKERHELMKKCGESCFLQPEDEGFPICAALREGQGCAIDCRGVTSARVRAAQWGYDEVEKFAEELQKKKCGQE
jgi:hypothetical protein